MGELATDREHLSLARAFVTVVAACPRYSGRKAADFDSKDVIRMLFTSIRSACIQCCLPAGVKLSVPLSPVNVPHWSLNARSHIYAGLAVKRSRPWL